MARRNIPIAPDLTRQDLKDAIDSLRGDLLDPSRPSLLSALNEHRQEVRAVVDEVHAFIKDEYEPLKKDYYQTKNRGVGYLAGAGFVGGGLWAFVRHFLFK